MYIWILGRAVPSEYNGMHGSFEFEQAQMIKKRGHKVVYIALTVTPRAILKYRDMGLRKSEKDGIKTYNVYLPFGITGKGRQFVRKKSAKKLFSLVSEENGLPDIVHAHFPSMWAYNAFEVFKKNNISIFVTEHWTEVLKKTVNNYIVENLRWFVNNSKKFICVGEPLKQSVIDLVSVDDADKKIIVIPNVVNGKFVYSKKEVDYNNFVFCAVGRLVECKRFDLLIDAFSETFNKSKNVHLKIIGGGIKNEELAEQIRKLHMEDQIHLTGIKSREETAHEIQKSDVLVCASNLETFGVPVIEGMACGKPVITTYAFAIPAVIDKTVGILIEMNNIDQMKGALKEMYETRNQYDEVSIINKAKIFFGEDAVIGKLIDLYES